MIMNIFYKLCQIYNNEFYFNIILYFMKYITANYNMN